MKLTNLIHSPRAARRPQRGRSTANPTRLVVGDRVEEVVVARVHARVAHGAERAEHGGAAVLELARERAVAGRDVLDLRRERVAARDRARRAVVAAREILGAARVLAGRHGGRLGDEAERDDLEEAEARDVLERREAHAVLEDVRELDRAVERDRARERDAELLDHHAEERHHGDAAVLDLDRAAARERLLLLEEEAGRGDRAGVAPPPPPKKATAGVARRARASLAILEGS